MSEHPHTKSERGALDDNNSTKRKSDLAKELKHTRAGIWDIYEQVPQNEFGFDVSWISGLNQNLTVFGDLPFFWKVVKDVIKIKSCGYYLCLFILVKVFLSLQPAVALWFTSHFLTVAQVAIDERRLDKQLLIFASVGRICCTMAKTFLGYLELKLQVPLDLLTREHFDKEVFGVAASLDVPTFEDKVVKHKLKDITGGGMGPRGPYGPAWGSLVVVINLFSSAARLITELGLLAKVVSSQQDGVSFAIAHIGQELLQVLLEPLHMFPPPHTSVAFTDDKYYPKVIGLEKLVHSSEHKQEIVAGNLGEFLKVAYKQAYDRVSGRCADLVYMHYHSQMSGRKQMMSVLLPESIEEMAEAVYLLKSATRPETIPACLATIKLIQATTGGFMGELWRIKFDAKRIGEQFHKIRQIYEIREIQNKIQSGGISFPEDNRSLASGITVEFRNVSFRYPEKKDFALRDVSFKIEKGQLCVIVGTNGSGKSTMLKLMLRLYDPTEGIILVNGHDIKTLELGDLRESVAVIFQDYTHFPLTVKENIALGDPRNAHDETRVREAARLGGAEEFVEKLNEGFDTYLERPVKDLLSVPGNAKTRSGEKIDRDLLREAIGRVGNEDTVKLSGGQMQRLAVSRMFMRAVLSEEARVGLLLFDEPSAALDPSAEHDLFTRIRKLRGEKTMIFSSHRFGQLTKPADLILYMDDSRVLECGNHHELMAKEGKYAELWNLQAQAFL